MILYTETENSSLLRLFIISNLNQSTNLTLVFILKQNLKSLVGFMPVTE